MEKIILEITCKNKHDYEMKKMILSFYDDLPSKKQVKFISLLKSIKTIVKDK